MANDRLYGALAQAIHEKTDAYTVYPSSFDQIREEYRDQYGERKWIGQLVQDWRGLKPSDGRAYQSARRQIERWNTGQTKPNKPAQNELKEFGKTLEPIQRGAPQSGLTFQVEGKQKEKGGGYRDRDFTISMSQNEAIQFLTDPNYVDFYDFYFDGAGELFEEGDYELYDVSIT